jgi:integrase
MAEVGRQLGQSSFRILTGTVPLHEGVRRETMQRIFSAAVARRFAVDCETLSAATAALKILCICRSRHSRRTCARLCRLAGGELGQIQFLLGHVSIQTTERYLGCKQKLRCAVNDRIGIEPEEAQSEVGGAR